MRRFQFSMIVLTTAVLVLFTLSLVMDGIMDMRTRKEDCITTETVSGVTKKYTDVRHVGRSWHRIHCIEVYNGEESPYKFDISLSAWDKVEVTDNVKLKMYWLEGELYDVVVPANDGVEFSCRNYIEKRDR